MNANTARDYSMLNSTEVRVISMESAVDRRREFSESAVDAGVGWQFHAAATGLTSDLIYDENRTRQRFGRALRRGELGCYASHFSLWKWLLESNTKQVIVFEDDVTVDWTAINRIAKQDMSEANINLLRLFSTHPFKSKVVRHKLLSDHSHLLRVNGNFFGTQGYLITRRAAEALVSAGRVVDAPVDWLMSRYWEFGIPNYCVFPFPLFERMMPSTIESRENVEPHRTLAERLAKLAWKVRDKGSRHWYELHHNSPENFGPLSDGAETKVFFQGNQ
jgi:glycosyl transferase family 25